jgi:zinc protease
MQEIVKEFREIQGKRPVTSDEFTQIQTEKTLNRAGELQTLESVSGLLREQITTKQPLDTPTARLQEIRALTPEDVRSVARAVLHPDNLIWLVVGDLSTIEANIRALDLGEVRVIEEEELDSL